MPQGAMFTSLQITGAILRHFPVKCMAPGKLPPGFQVVHTMDCRNPNEIVTGEIESWRVQKLILHPQK